MSLCVCAAALSEQTEILDAGDRGGWEAGAQADRPER